jgi:hypothetical protein
VDGVGRKITIINYLFFSREKLMIVQSTTTLDPNLNNSPPDYMNPSVICPHKRFDARVTIESDTIKVYVEARCLDCNRQIIFPGVGPRITLQGTI